METARVEAFHLLCATLAKQPSGLPPEIGVQLVRFPAVPDIELSQSSGA